MEINPQLLAVIGTLGGAIIGSFVTLFITWINNRFEERKYFHQLALTTATESWKKCIDHANQQGKGVVDSLDTFIIHLVALSDSLRKKPITSSNILSILNDVDSISNEVRKYRERNLKSISGKKSSEDKI